MNDLLPTYVTNHIPLAAYLKVKGMKIINITIKENRGCFEFEHVIRDFIIEFNNGTAAVEPAEYADRMSQLTQTAKRLMKELGGH